MPARRGIPIAEAQARLAERSTAYSAAVRAHHAVHPSDVVHLIETAGARRKARRLLLAAEKTLKIATIHQQEEDSMAKPDPRARREFFPSMISLKVPADWGDRMFEIAYRRGMSRSDWMRSVLSRSLESAERRDSNPQQQRQRRSTTATD